MHRPATLRRQLQQAPAPTTESGLLAALQGIRSSLPPGGSSPAGATDGATASGGSGSGPGPGQCTDSSLLSITMSTFCKLDSLEQLATISQDAVQACCRLTSATLQPGCWDACVPPAAASQQVLEVLRLWRNICLINVPVVCEEQPGAQP